jgi:hypothetical protein
MANQYDDVAYIRWQLRTIIQPPLDIVRYQYELYITDNSWSAIRHLNKMKLSDEIIKQILASDGIDNDLYRALMNCGLGIRAALAASLTYG